MQRTLSQPTEVGSREDTASSFRKETARSQRKQMFLDFVFWNDLPEHLVLAVFSRNALYKSTFYLLTYLLVTADSVNIFKNRFDKHCSHLRFCADIEDLFKKR